MQNHIFHMTKAVIAHRLRPSKNRFFDGLTVLCLSSFGLASGKEHRETARPGRSVPPDEPAQPE